MWRRPSARNCAHGLTGGRGSGRGERRGHRAACGAWPQTPGQPGDGLVGQRVAGAGGGEHQRVELADPRRRCSASRSRQVEHLEERRLEAEHLRWRGSAGPRGGRRPRRRARGHVDLGVVGLGEQQRARRRSRRSRPDEPVDDGRERRLGRARGTPARCAGRGACARTSSTSALIVAADRGSRLPWARATRAGAVISAASFVWCRGDRRRCRRWGGGRGLASWWIPHSVLPVPAQRPLRGSSPGATRRVHGQQPIEG